MVASGRPMANDSCAARFDDIANGAQRIAEVFSIVFLVAAAKEGYQFAIKIDLFQRREEIVPIALGFTVVPGWDAEQQDIVSFQILFAAFGNVVNISNIFTKLPKKMPMIAMSKITS